MTDHFLFFFCFVIDFLAFEAGQSLKAHFQNCVSLFYRKIKFFHQIFMRVFFGFRRPYSLDYGVNMVERFFEPFEYMGAFLGFFQIEFCPSFYDVLSPGDEIFSGPASFFRSIAIVSPSLSDSSRMSRIPSILFSRTKSAIFIISSDLFTLYGIDEIIIWKFPFDFSTISASPRVRIDPRPVEYACNKSFFEKISPPVGKSGPFMNSIRSSVVALGCPIRCDAASIASPKLCGGIFVAMPTAIPSVPFRRRLGRAAGRTTGSLRVPS